MSGFFRQKRVLVLAILLVLVLAASLTVLAMRSNASSNALKEMYMPLIMKQLPPITSTPTLAPANYQGGW